MQLRNTTVYINRVSLFVRSIRYSKSVLLQSPLPILVQQLRKMASNASSVEENQAATTAAATSASAAAGGRVKTRLTKESGARTSGGVGTLGGPFTREVDPAWLQTRVQLYDEIIGLQKARLARKPREPIVITLPDGKQKDGISWETTPLAIAESISKGLAAAIVVAKVAYTRRIGVEAEDGGDVVNTGPEEEDESTLAPGTSKPELWDLTRPLEGDCKLELLKFDDKEGKMVFWHSSAHVLGECLECNYGGKLCIGPPTEDGFYYDTYLGDQFISDTDFPTINAKAESVVKAKQPFERIVLKKEEALRLFADNPFKQQLISTKIPDGGYTTAYRCGPLIDLCRGPHVPTTAAIKAFEVMKASASYWLGSQENDTLQRVYGVSFPDAKQLKEYKFRLEEAKKRDHRTLGTKQELFFFHELSPGSCFFLPHGARIYNKLVSFIRNEYIKRGYDEVVTPNMYNIDLWRISGHAEHYLENMFTFDVEGAGFGLKPMNCPGHCLMFDHRMRSYRELPIRMADFGVLHRNEFSGALTGLTRVRRFQQDDAHIFCRMDQIKEEVAGALDFMKHTYGVFGFDFELDLSTRPKKALGSLELWNTAEAMMKEALDAFGRPWRINAGDGAFYGPKIDIKVFDALGRRHQCATIQLDFQLPLRFNLRYQARRAGAREDDAAADNAVGENEANNAEAEGNTEVQAPESEIATSHAHVHATTRTAVAAAIERVQRGDTDDLPEGFERPVIIHRAILGSVERMMAVLIEHTAGRWPFWISPRQIRVVPVAQLHIPYARKVRDTFHAAGFHCDLDGSRETLNKKIREAQLAQYNFILVVGSKEEEEGTVNIRTRDNKVHGTKKIDETIAMFKKLEEEYK